MPEYNVEFVRELEFFAEKAEDRVNETRKLLAYSLFSRIIDRTPVYFTFEKTAGNTKYNWRVTINKLPNGVLKGTDKTGKKTKERSLKQLGKVTGDDTIFFSNCLGHAIVLEDGLYPKNVKRGSYNRQTGKYEIRSSGGYSKQSPSGMVKITIAEFPYLKDKAVAEAKSKIR